MKFKVVVILLFFLAGYEVRGIMAIQASLFSFNEDAPVRILRLKKEVPFYNLFIFAPNITARFAPNKRDAETAMLSQSDRMALIEFLSSQADEQKRNIQIEDDLGTIYDSSTDGAVRYYRPWGRNKGWSGYVFNDNEVKSCNEYYILLYFAKPPEIIGDETESLKVFSNPHALPAGEIFFLIGETILLKITDSRVFLIYLPCAIGLHKNSYLQIYFTISTNESFRAAFEKIPGNYFK